MEKTKLIIGLIMVLLIGLLVGACFIFRSSGSRSLGPSEVNISYLYQIIDYPMYEIDELQNRLNKIKENYGVINFEGKPWTVFLSDDDLGRRWIYTYNMESVVNSVQIGIFNNQQSAKNSFFWDIRNNRNKRKNKLIQISEYIDVVLWNVMQFYDEYGSPINKVTYTDVRIGNIHIYFKEYSENGLLTSDNIKYIVQVLME